MRATCWYGKTDMRVEEVPDPQILNQQDAIVKISSTAICGSDLHMYNGFIPTMKKGDVLGHEFMGEVVEIGREVKNLQIGDRVVVPFTISCGKCGFCRAQAFSLCENSNPNAWLAEKLLGHATCGIFGYSHMTGGFAGGQAEYARVPFADVGPIKVPNNLSDEQVLFLSDIYPTGYMGAEMCNIQPGDTIAIWGCGPVGQFSIRCAFLLGAERVIAIDQVPERLQMAEQGGAETINYEEENVYEKLMDMTGGRGPDSCIDDVGMEAHAPAPIFAYDRIKQALMLETDRPHALREAIMCCKNGGTISVIGVYAGFDDKFPMGSVMQRSLTIKTGQAHMQRYMRPLLELIENGDIDPSFVVTHRMPLEEAPYAYDIFKNKRDNCIKVVLKPDWNGNGNGNGYGGTAKDDNYTVIH
jgi:threonine dehydrogenase-like Zn-dependent dehydrogenase